MPQFWNDLLRFTDIKKRHRSYHDFKNNVNRIPKQIKRKFLNRRVDRGVGRGGKH